MSDGSRIVEVRIDSLSAEALEGVVDEFVTRDGTDYGEIEYSLEQKRRAVMAQLHRGEVALVFDLETRTCDLVLRRELRCTAAACR